MGGLKETLEAVRVLHFWTLAAIPSVLTMDHLNNTTTRLGWLPPRGSHRGAAVRISEARRARQAFQTEQGHGHASGVRDVVDGDIVLGVRVQTEQGARYNAKDDQLTGLI